VSGWKNSTTFDAKPPIRNLADIGTAARGSTPSGLLLINPLVMRNPVGLLISASSGGTSSLIVIIGLASPVTEGMTSPDRFAINAAVLSHPATTEWSGATRFGILEVCFR
jgi:hypothetical protein